jgi:hypothetical protein
MPHLEVSPVLVSPKILAISTLINARRSARAGWSRFDDWGAAVAVERIFGDAIFSILSNLTIDECRAADLLLSISGYQSAAGSRSADYFKEVA